MYQFRPEIKTPASDLPALSVCGTDLESITAWISALPMENTIETAKQLHRITSEVARLTADGSTRGALLELLRPPVHYVCARLDRNAFGSQHAGEGLAQLSQSLQLDLVNGYKAIIRDAAETPQGAERESIGQAIHRAISDLSRMLL